MHGVSMYFNHGCSLWVSASVLLANISALEQVFLCNGRSREEGAIAPSKSQNSQSVIYTVWDCMENS